MYVDVVFVVVDVEMVDVVVDDEEVIIVVVVWMFMLK